MQILLFWDSTLQDRANWQYLQSQRFFGKIFVPENDPSQKYLGIASGGFL
jgi:hypothetical protein